MYTAILIAKPGALEAAMPEALRNAWGGGEILWLSEGEAAEFPIDRVPGNYRAVWEDLQGQGVDLNVVPRELRRKRILIADMDSTMIQQECIDEMAAYAGIGDKVAEITARAMDGKLDFEEAMLERVGLIKGLPVVALQEVFDRQITFMPGGKTLVSTMRANKAYAALVSGGFTFFTERVGGAMGFDETRANVLIVDGDVLAGDVERPILGREAKVDALKDVTARLGVGPEHALAVGDGANDLGMLGLAGLGVALHAKPSVQEECPVRVNHGDLTALLYLQGYAKADFVDD
ncbi:phosphoserine phosphatase SerB [Shimia ponticola]|uniref:phosphoserine phosphatase SerB n=1 Tax=Shimia ponticola TaxID=2582893 RepID=UPI0011BD88E0|nr:phosphoserine phosphatase SerB [Shimia ponticola]